MRDILVQPRRTQEAAACQAVTLEPYHRRSEPPPQSADMAREA
jgi:hypothetical protein